MKLFLIFSTILLLFLVSCTLETDEENHIHSIGFDPTEPGTLYLATHFYLEKINLETDEKERYGEGNDYMGFVISSDGTFYSSGHSERLGEVGIRKSTDKGRSWDILAYKGRDFHDMAVSYDDRKKVYAWSTPPEVFLTITSDNGETWTKAGNALDMDVYALAADHQQSNKLYAGTLYGLFVSEDEGKTWNKYAFENIPIIAIADDPVIENKITVATTEQILQTIDDGKSWQDLNFPQKEEVMIFLTTDLSSGELYGVTKHNLVYFLKDGTWNKVELEVE